MSSISRRLKTRHSLNPLESGLARIWPNRGLHDDHVSHLPRATTCNQMSIKIILRSTSLTHPCQWWHRCRAAHYLMRSVITNASIELAFGLRFADTVGLGAPYPKSGHSCHMGITNLSPPLWSECSLSGEYRALLKLQISCFSTCLRAKDRSQNRLHTWHTDGLQWRDLNVLYFCPSFGPVSQSERKETLIADITWAVPRWNYAIPAAHRQTRNV